MGIHRKFSRLNVKEYILAHHETMTVEEMVAALEIHHDRFMEVAKLLREELGIKVLTQKQKEQKQRTDFIRDNPKMTATEMANELGVNRDMIIGICYKQNLPYKKMYATDTKRDRSEKSGIFNVHAKWNWMVG